jgi:hypothetical protein
MNISVNPVNNAQVCYFNNVWLINEYIHSWTTRMRTVYKLHYYFESTFADEPAAHKEHKGSCYP